MKKIVFLIMVFAFFFSTFSYGESIRLNEKEKELMLIAYAEGKNLDCDFPEIIQMILLNESVAGRYGPVGDKHLGNWKKRSYGVMQLQFKTAKAVAYKKYGKHLLNDKEFIYQLVTNPSYNIHIARLYYEYLYNIFKDKYKALLAYNVGPRNVKKYGFKYDPNNYVSKALDHLKDTIRPFNKPIKYKEMLTNMIHRDIKRIGNGRMFSTHKSITHIIVKGDTFSKLSQIYFGDWRKWKRIQNLNLHLNPYKLKIGEIIKIK